MTYQLFTLWEHLAPLAAAAPAGKGKGTSPAWSGQLIFLFLMFVVLYLFMIRPQQKRQRRRMEMLGALTKGDNVVTTGGVKGVITLVRDHEVVVKVDDNVKLTLLKSGVASIVTDPGAAHES